MRGPPENESAAGTAISAGTNRRKSIKSSGVTKCRKPVKVREAYLSLLPPQSNAFMTPAEFVAQLLSVGEPLNLLGNSATTSFPPISIQGVSTPIANRFGLSACSLRFSPSLSLRLANGSPLSRPVLFAALIDIKTCELRAISRTFLKPHCSKQGGPSHRRGRSPQADGRTDIESLHAVASQKTNMASPRSYDGQC
jgi:hypothetical protein